MSLHPCGLHRMWKKGHTSFSGEQTDVHEHFMPVKPTENPTKPKTVHLTAVPESKFILFLAPIGLFFLVLCISKLQPEKKYKFQFDLHGTQALV